MDARELGKKSRIELGNYKPTVGGQMDYYDTDGNKQDGTVKSFTGTHVTVTDNKTKKAVKLQVVKESKASTGSLLDEAITKVTSKE